MAGDWKIRGEIMGFSVETLVVGPIEENCYVLKDEETGHGLIIDP